MSELNSKPIDLTFDHKGAVLLFEAMQANGPRTISFETDGPGILLRHDVDADLAASYRMAVLEASFGIRATYFMLDTASYWDTPEMWNMMENLVELGHWVAWHNNVLPQYFDIEVSDSDLTFREIIEGLVAKPVELMRLKGFRITGSASHGDRRCFELGVINYETFYECERIPADKGFPAEKRTHPRCHMADFGLRWEAYHVQHDLYLSESGGRKWNQKFSQDDLLNTNRVQILIHPQWWEL